MWEMGNYLVGWETTWSAGKLPGSFPVVSQAGKLPGRLGNYQVVSQVFSLPGKLPWSDECSQEQKNVSWNGTRAPALVREGT